MSRAGHRFVTLRVVAMTFGDLFAVSALTAGMAVPRAPVLAGPPTSRAPFGGRHLPNLAGMTRLPDLGGLTGLSIAPFTTDDPWLADALWYARSAGWPVLPASADPDRAASADEATLRGWWDCWPGTPAALAAGVAFEVVDVPLAAGRDALRRLRGPGPRQHALGPVAATSGGRMWLWVAAGAQQDLPGLLDWLDWADVGLDLHVHGPGQRVLAPARPDGGRGGRAVAARWLLWPGAADSLPTLDALLDPLAHACHRLQTANPRQTSGVRRDADPE